MAGELLPYSVESIRKRIEMSDEFARVTGYPAHTYYDTMTDLRHLLAEYDALARRAPGKER